MNRRRLVLRALAYYWRTNLAVVAGVATAVAVLAGALVVGDSVRGTLRHLALDRIGATDLVVTAPRFFREALADDIRSDPRFESRFARIAPLVVSEALVTAQVSGRRAGRVLVYGVDDRFWRFHGVDPPPMGDRGALVSPALAAETGLAVGDAALVRVAMPSAIPLESLHSDKDAVGRSLRVTVSGVLARRAAVRLLAAASTGRDPGDLRPSAAIADRARGAGTREHAARRPRLVDAGDNRRFSSFNFATTRR